ncbi:15795_t:CDS:2, partial [Acaulospora colombiana]
TSVSACEEFEQALREVEISLVGAKIRELAKNKWKPSGRDGSEMSDVMEVGLGMKQSYELIGLHIITASAAGESRSEEGLARALALGSVSYRYSGEERHREWGELGEQQIGFIEVETCLFYDLFGSDLRAEGRGRGQVAALNMGQAKGACNLGMPTQCRNMYHRGIPDGLRFRGIWAAYVMNSARVSRGPPGHMSPGGSYISLIDGQLSSPPPSPLPSSASLGKHDMDLFSFIFSNIALEAGVAEAEVEQPTSGQAEDQQNIAYY